MSLPAGTYRQIRTLLRIEGWEVNAKQASTGFTAKRGEVSSGAESAADPRADRCRANEVVAMARA